MCPLCIWFHHLYYECSMDLYTFLLTWIPAWASLLHSPWTWHINLFSCFISQYGMFLESDQLKHLIFWFFKNKILRYRKIWTRCNTLFKYSFKPKCYCYCLKICREYLAGTSFFLFPVVYMVSCGLRCWHSWQIKLPSESMPCIYV